MIERINLLPDELKQVEIKRYIRRFLILLSVIYVVGSGLLYYHQKLLLIEKEKVVDSLTGRKEILLSENAGYNRLMEKINLTRKKERNIKDRIEVIGSLVRSKIYWSEIMRRITLLVPDELWLTSLTSYDPADSQSSRSRKRIKFTGTAFSNAKIAEFIFALENSTILENVFLSYSKKRGFLGRDLFDFELTAERRN